jgi:DNA mismatch repair ATPase MutL
MACRGAVKAHHVLSPTEAGALCRDMDRKRLRRNLSPRQPTYVLLSKRDLERMFKR